MDIAHQLREAGKQVCLSTMTLLEAPALVRDMARYVDNGEFMIEANEIGAIQLAHEKSLPFVVGSPINYYNQHTLNRSEERRVGKECRYRWSTDHEKKKKKDRERDRCT